MSNERKGKSIFDSDLFNESDAEILNEQKNQNKTKDRETVQEEHLRKQQEEERRFEERISKEFVVEQRHYQNKNQEAISNNQKENSFNGNNTNVNSEDLFFEKFNTTKKNYKKQELERARKSIDKKNKMLSFDRRLENNRYLLKIYLILFIIMFFVLSLTITTFVLNFPFYDGTISDENAWFGISTAISVDYLDMNRAIIIMDGIAFSILPIPFFFLLCTWFIGLNQVFRSRKFILLLFFVVGLSVVLSIITIPMFSIIYSYHTLLPIKQ